MSNQPSIAPEHLHSTLTTALSATHVAIVDQSGGCGSAYAATIVSPLFAQKTTLARHRLVNKALKEEIALIHAWTPKCYTPLEWETVRGKGNGEEDNGMGKGAGVKV